MGIVEIVGIMVRLQKKRRPRNFLDRREQWRLLALVLALGLVVVVMNEVRRPETEALLARVFSGERVLRDAEPPVSDAGIAALVSQRNDDRPVDAFRTPSVGGAVAVADDRYYPGVRPELLDAIRDNTVFRNAETDAWFHLWEILQSSTPQDLAGAASGEVGYVEMVEQPKAYRGRLVTVRGTARRVETLQPAENGLGLERFYVLTLRPAGSQIWPIRVYCLELPSEFPRAGDVSAEIAATGFFFKNWSYRWQGGMGLAPVVLARGIKWLDRPTPTVDAEREMPSLFVVTTVAAALALGLVGFVVWSSRRQSVRHVASRLSSVILLSVCMSSAAWAQHTNDDLREILYLDGWNDAAWEEFEFGQPLSDGEIERLLRLVRRLRSFDALSIDRWTRDDVAVTELNVDDHAQLVRLSGRIERCERRPLSSEDAERFGIAAYYLGEVAVDGGELTATVLTVNVPQAWQRVETLDEPARFAGLPVKRASADGEPLRVVFVAPRIEWHPTGMAGVNHSFGRAVLGSAGYDVGLLDQIKNRGRIRSVEREAFYQMLDVAGRFQPQQLAQQAEKDLPRAAAEWEALAAEPSPRQLLAQTVLDRAAESCYSVAPLFNDPDGQIGNLLVLDGVARRAVRVEVVRTAGGGPSDVARRFGFDHYFEVDVFTDDSQNYPVVFCVRELPAGFPTGEKIREPVRVAGFFFKSWLHDTRQAADRDAVVGASQQEFAPLLVGPATLWIQPPAAASNPWPGLIGGGLFVLVLVAIWAYGEWSQRRERAFRARAIEPQFTVPEGESLNDVISDGGGGVDLSGLGDEVDAPDSG